MIYLRPFNATHLYPPKETASALLQFLGLVIPVVAIYLQIVYSDEKEYLNHASKAATFQGVRLTLTFLLLATIPFLVEIFLTPDGLEKFLIGIGLVFVFIAVVTFLLAVLFSQEGLDNPFSIFWVYRNAGHRIEDFLYNLFSRKK